MFAQVIVDVPVKQVNRPFEYKIPEIFEGEIEVGMRVVVPFAGRSVQGFVVSIRPTSDFEGELKEIERLMDLEPVLSKEMIELGEYMSNHLFAFLIHCYQTMLPAMLKTTTRKFFILENPQEHEEVYQEVFKGQTEIEVTDEMSKETLAKLLRLKQKGIVQAKTLVEDRKQIKTEDWIVLSYLPEEYLEMMKQVPKNAAKQLRFLEGLSSLENTEISKAEFMTRFNVVQADVKKAIDKEWITLEKRAVDRDPYAGRKIVHSKPFELNEEQKQVFQQVLEEDTDETSHVYLLQGVTGSGKTEVYLQWIGEAIQKGKSAMMLVPEISLTPQMVQRFKERFGNRVAVLHSGLNPGEKHDEWQKIKEGRADIVVGARSSVFAPLENIGIIILDEEHESTYKQDDTPRYHARDIAIWRGKYHHCPVVLGSATPSLESRARAEKRVYRLLRLTKRAKHQPLPQVHVLDMKQEFLAQKGSFSKRLLQALEDRLEKGEQSVLLLNRRGYSSFIMCRDCGYVLECPNCDISLTLHMDTKVMKCHYCGHEEAIPNHCPKCHSRQIRYFGTGTQKLQEELEQLLPTARIIRMDVDTTRKKGQHEALLKQFEEQKADILIGTQMIAKGLDFPNVTLVGVVNADTALNIPDFRAAEKTFQLLTQVAGRAGRGDKAGEVFIQTYNPDHYAIQLAQHHYYEAFFAQEMKMRHLAHYPPYYFTVMITVSSEQEYAAQKQAYEIKKILEGKLSSQSVLLGPSAKSIARMNNRYYYQLIIKYKKDPVLDILLHEVLVNTQSTPQSKVAVSIDVEPQYFL